MFYNLQNRINVQTFGIEAFMCAKIKSVHTVKKSCQLHFNGIVLTAHFKDEIFSLVIHFYLTKFFVIISYKLTLMILYCLPLKLFFNNCQQQPFAAIQQGYFCVTYCFLFWPELLLLQKKVNLF